MSGSEHNPAVELMFREHLLDKIDSLEAENERLLKLNGELYAVLMAISGFISSLITAPTPQGGAK